MTINTRPVRQTSAEHGANTQYLTTWENTSSRPGGIFESLGNRLDTAANYGIHPLAALNSQGVNIGAPGANLGGGSGRAVGRRASALSDRMSMAQLEYQKLRNKALRLQIRREFRPPRS